MHRLSETYQQIPKGWQSHYGGGGHCLHSAPSQMEDNEKQKRQNWMGIQKESSRAVVYFSTMSQVVI